MSSTLQMSNSQLVFKAKEKARCSGFVIRNLKTRLTKKSAQQLILQGMQDFKSWDHEFNITNVEQPKYLNNQKARMARTLAKFALLIVFK